MKKMYKDEDGSDANEHADDYDYMTLQLEDSEEYEVQVLSDGATGRYRFSGFIESVWKNR